MSEITLEFSEFGWVEFGNSLFSYSDSVILSELEKVAQRDGNKWSREVEIGPVSGPGDGALHHPLDPFCALTTEIVQISFITGSICVTFVRLARPLLEQWIKNKAGRSMVLKKGDIEIRINGSHDIDKAIEVLNTMEKSKSRTIKATTKALPTKRISRNETRGRTDAHSKKDK